MEKKERNYNSYCELPEGEEASSPAKTAAKRESRKGKENRDIRILKKGKSIKERNDPDRFSGEGVTFRAKIIGTENVYDARGNRMCQGALQRLKTAVKSSGDHKQKIILNISLEGIIIKDEKSGEALHCHPIHKISFISQDTKDSRAFGYVYGCPQTGHQFFAIKTEKSASQVVVTLRDLFLVALEMKKSEIERNQNSEQPEDACIRDPVDRNDRENGVSNGSVEIPSSPTYENGGPGPAVTHGFLYSNTVLLPEESIPERRLSNVSESKAAIHSLFNLQSEVDSLQQGISQMDHSIATTISQNLGISFSEDDVSESSSSSIPTAFQFKLDKLASLYQETMSISSRSSSTSDYNVGAAEMKVEESDTPKKDPFANPAPTVPEACSSGISSLSIGSNSTVSEEASHSNSASGSVVEDRYAVFLDIDSMHSIFDDPSIVKIPEEKTELPAVDQNYSDEKIELTGISPNCSGEKIEFPTDCSDESEMETSGIKSSTPVAFAELDPLGNQPYVDRRDFFQDIKNPPKRVLKDLVGTSSDFFSDAYSGSQESLTFDDSKMKTQEKVFVLQEISSCMGIPPKLPPKRSVAVSSEQQPNSVDPKNPFNPFLCEEYPDIPPPSSPPPPPPPRLPTKLSESSPTLSPPPPRPPSRVNDVPTPPLPKRKVPLNSANRTWFSFDQDAVSFPPAPFVPEVVDPDANYAPPLPSPARKLPPPKLESPLLKSSSASNSPATLRRLYNKSPRLGSSAITDVKDPKVSIIPNSPKAVISRHSCILQENDAVLSPVNEIKDLKLSVVTNSPKKGLVRHASMLQEMDAFSSPVFNPFFQPKEAISEGVERSPPLPPKPVLISRSRPSPLKRGHSVSSYSSSGVSVVESSNGTHSSSSLVFSSLDENKIGSSSEALFTNSSDSASDVFSQSSKETISHPINSDIFSRGDTETPVQTISSDVSSQNSKETTQLQSSNGSTEEKPADVSPDSIFRRKSDPFADDFFLSLHKKSNCDSPSIAKTSNGIEEHFDDLKAPT